LCGDAWGTTVHRRKIAWACGCWGRYRPGRARQSVRCPHHRGLWGSSHRVVRSPEIVELVGVMPLGSLLLGGLASLTGHVAYVIVGGGGVAPLVAAVVGVVARDPRRDS